MGKQSDFEVIQQLRKKAVVQSVKHGINFGGTNRIYLFNNVQI